MRDLAVCYNRIPRSVKIYNMSQSAVRKKYLYRVAPLVRLPLIREAWFTYASDTPIPAGSLVRIPLFRRTVSGIVLGPAPRAKTPFRVKDIDSITRESFLTKEQLATAEFLSSEYFTPLGYCFRHFLPAIAKRRLGKTEKETTGEPVTAPKENKSDRALIRTLTRPMTDKPRPFLVTGSGDGTSLNAVFTATKKLAGKKEQVLILVPEIIAIETMRRTVARHWPGEVITLIHSRLSAGTYFENWERIRQGEARVIVGTRQALFAPFTRLAAIIVNDEANDTYKQWDMSPRYDGRRVAREIARLHTARLFLLAGVPSLASWWQSSQDNGPLIAIDAHAYATKDRKKALRAGRSPFVIADLKFERWKKNFSPLSVALKDALSTTLDRKEQALLFVNHQGMSRFSVCTHCKNVIRCPDCHQALVLDREGTYYCLHCTYRSDIFFACPVCRGTQFRNVGLGTERVEREVERVFPGARVARLDRKSLAKGDVAGRTAARFLDRTIDILVGTQTVLNEWNLKNLSLVGIIDADSLFSLPDFHGDEKAVRVLLRSADQVVRCPHGQVIIQTFHPENPTIGVALKNSWEEFYRRLAEERQALHYPPFTRVVLLIGKSASAESLDIESKNLYDKLSGLSQKGGSFRPAPPAHPLHEKSRGMTRRHILIRFPADQPFPPALDAFLRRLPKGWSIDVDPVSIL